MDRVIAAPKSACAMDRVIAAPKRLCQGQGAMVRAARSLLAGCRGR